MKRTLIILLAIVLGQFALAQKYACFDSEYVFSNIPDYQQAQKRLDQYVSDWQKELESKAQELDNLKKAYQQEAYLLPENLKRRRMDDIKTKEQELKALQHEHFDVGGDLDKKRAELIKPVQDRVYNALNRLATEKNYAIIFDKAGTSTIAYANAKYDVSNQVLEMLGITPGTKSGDGKQEAGAERKGGSSADKGKISDVKKLDKQERAGNKDRLDKGDNTRKQERR